MEHSSDKEVSCCQTQEAANAQASNIATLTAESPRVLGTVPEMVRGYQLARRMPFFSYMELILTGNCNLRCSYCWEKGGKPVDMSEETAFAAIDFFMETSRNLRELTVLFFGGEPLLRFDLMQRVWDYGTECAKALGKRISWNMTTNGTLLNEEIMRWLAKHKVKYLLSVDGGREDHDRFRRFADGRGSFDVIAGKIALMKRYQPWMGARMSVMPESCATLRKSIEELHSLGINQFILGYAHGIRWTTENLIAYESAMRDVCELYLEMKFNQRHFRMTIFEAGDIGKLPERDKFGCGAGRARFSVDPYGAIYGCSKMANITGLGNGVLPLGNVFQGFTRIQNRKPLLNASIVPREKCRKCEFKDRCSGGCPALSYSCTGSIYLPGEIGCKIWFISDRIDEYMKRRYKEVFGREIDEEDKTRETKANE